MGGSSGESNRADTIEGCAAARQLITGYHHLRMGRRVITRASPDVCNPYARELRSTILLEGEGYQVVQFHSLTDARATFDLGTAVDLVICDVILRGGGTSRGFIADLGIGYPALPVLEISGLAAEQAVDLLGGGACPAPSSRSRSRWKSSSSTSRRW